MSRILFLYATREGQTRRICECMADEVRQQGHEVELVALESGEVDAALLRCEAVVLGASIRYGHLPAALYAFIARWRNELDARRGAFFCVNLTARKPGKDTPAGSAYMRRFLKKSAWQPPRLAVFPGALLYTRYTWYDRVMIRFIMWLTGGPTDPSRDVEFTDWDEVRRFARSLA